MTDCIFCNGTGKQNPHRRDNGDPLGRAINESHRYQAMLFQAWRALRGQTKGLQRQRRLIKRLQAQLTASSGSAPETVSERDNEPR